MYRKMGTARRAAVVTGLSVILAGSFALGAAAPAEAVTAYPDGWSPKAFITNMLSSVMAAVGNTPAKRALIANSQKYDHSFEGLDVQLKLKAAAGTPDSYSQYVIDKQQYFLDNNMTSTQGDTSGKKIVQTVSAPAAAARKLGGTNVSGGLAITSGIASAEFGFQVGKAVSGAFGLDVLGGICDPAGGVGGGLVPLLTGTDCSTFLNPDPGFKANQDMAGLAPGGACDSLAALPSSSTNLGTSVSGWSIVCRSMGDYVDLYPATTKYLDGWLTYNTVTKNTDGSLVISWSYTGPQPPSTYYQYTQVLPVAVCVAGGTVQGGASIPNFYPPSNWAATGTWTTGAPNCGTGGAVWLLGRGGDASGTSNGKLGVIYSPGGTLASVQSTDPSRTVQCSILGSDGNTYTQNSPSYTQGTANMPAPTCPTLPDGVYAKNLKADLNGGATPQPLYNQPTTPQYQSWATLYPECVDGACPLVLVDKRPAVPISCFTNPATALACDGWMADPAKATNFQCTYGAHNVDISECYVYGDTFNPQKIAAGQAYSDPATGLSVPGQSSPSAAGDSLGKAITDPKLFQNCLNKGWGVANPVEWVMVPVQCALQWAFTPSKVSLATLETTIPSAFSNTVFGQVGDLVAPFQSIPVWTGCSGIPIDIVETWPIDWAIHWNFGESCTGPLASTADTVRGVSGALIGAGAILTLLSFLGVGVGFRGLGRRS